MEAYVQHSIPELLHETPPTLHKHIVAFLNLSPNKRSESKEIIHKIKQDKVKYGALIHNYELLYALPKGKNGALIGINSTQRPRQANTRECFRTQRRSISKIQP